MDNHRGQERHSRQVSPGGWWAVGLAGLAAVAVGVVVLGIVLAVRLLLYLLEVGPT